MLTCCAIRCEAQQARVIEKLADGSFVVSIDNVEFRALGADKVREIQKQKIDLDAATKTNGELQSQIQTQAQEVALLKKDFEIVGLQKESFERDFNRAQADGKRNFELFQSERALRVEAGSFIPHGKTSGFWGKILDGLDHPASQDFWKLAVPTYQMMRCR